MEKLGIEKNDLINELKKDYETLRSRLSTLVKTGSAVGSETRASVEASLRAVKEKIDQVLKEF
jgi:hypothetical protein